MSKLTLLLVAHLYQRRNKVITMCLFFSFDPLAFGWPNFPVTWGKNISKTVNKPHCKETNKTYRKRTLIFAFPYFIFNCAKITVEIYKNTKVHDDLINLNPDQSGSKLICRTRIRISMSDPEPNS